MGNYIDLSSYKAAFIDFDDTLYTHLDHGKWDDWFMNCLNGSAASYLEASHGCAGVGMKEFVDRLNLVGVHTFCITTMNSSIVVIPKQKWCDETFGKGKIQQVIGVKDDAYKIQFALEYGYRMGITNDKILICDNSVKVCELAEDNGLKWMTPQEVAVTLANGGYK